MQNGKKVRGYCAVCGDILHIGHVLFIAKCRAKCDELIVGVMSDLCIKEYKGKYPVMNFFERAEVILGLRDVEGVVSQDSFEFPENLKEKYKIDIIFDSEEHKRKGADILIPYYEGVSSSQIKERIIESGR